MRSLIIIAAAAALIPAAASAQMTTTNCMGSGPFVHCDSMTMAPPPPPPAMAAPDGINPGAAALGIFVGRLVRHRLDLADTRRLIANNITAGHCEDAQALAIQKLGQEEVAQVMAACPITSQGVAQ